MKINIKEIKYLSKITNSLYDELKIEFLYHSNHLEGSTFTKEGLAKLLELKQIEGTHSLDDIIETRNSLEVFDELVRTSDKLLDKYLLFSWHRTLKKGTVDEEIHNTGMWKKYENRLKGVDLTLASPTEVESKMFNLLEDWKEIKNPTIDDIAIFHYKFEAIHPFQDGNGRIGRFIILKQCLEKNIDLIAIDKEYQNEYKESLYHAQKTGDVTVLVDVFKKCQKRLDDKLSNFKPLLDSIKNEISD